MGGVIDSIAKSVYFLLVVVIFAIFALLWISMRPMFSMGLTNTTQIATINNLGNNFFLNQSDSMLVFFYFALVFVMFASAIGLGSHPLAIPFGIILGIGALLTSFFISDIAHTILYNALLVPATSHLPGSLYILDWLPVITVFEIIGYMIFSSVFVERIRSAIGLETPRAGGGLYHG